MSRDAYVVGSITPGDVAPKVAMRCGWCGEWKSQEDRIRHVVGAPISHGICERCARKHFPHDSETNATPEGGTPEGRTERGGDWPPPAA